MKLYIAGPMRGIPEFNFPAFLDADTRLQNMGHMTFNPAQKDIDLHGDAIYKGRSGDLREIAHLGFSLRESLGYDLEFICKQADGIVLLEGWEQSSGARAELATCKALGIPAYRLAYDGAVDGEGWHLEELKAANVVAVS